MIPSVPAHPSAVTILGSWQFDPILVSALVATAAVYGAAVRRAWRTRGRGAFPSRRVVSFAAGLAVLFLTLQSPVDTYSDLLLSVHMTQHLLIAMVAAPLLVLGAPVTLFLESTSARSRRRFLLPVLRSRALKVLGAPLVGWALFAGVMWGTHYAPVYDAALRSENIHSLEHLAYLGSALLFWWAVVGLDPNPGRISYPARLLYLFLAMPVTAILGLAVSSANRILYPHYAAASPSIGVPALADQRLAGTIMWEGGMLLVLPALALVFLQWTHKDEQEALRADARLARGPG